MCYESTKNKKKKQNCDACIFILKATQKKKIKENRERNIKNTTLNDRIFGDSSEYDQRSDKMKTNKQNVKRKLNQNITTKILIRILYMFYQKKKDS